MNMRILLFAVAAAMIGTALAEHSGVRRNPSGKDLERLQFNNPEAVVPLHHSVFGGFFVGDWDKDGKLDIIVNHAANCQLWLQKKAADGTWQFEIQKGTMAKEPLWSHDPVPGVCDFNADGKPDLLFGAMDGHVYYMRNPRTK